MLIQLPCQAGGDNRIAQAWGHCQMMLSGKDISGAVTEPPCGVPLLWICWPFFPPTPKQKEGGGWGVCC